MSSLKIEFDTVRDLEKKCHQVFAWGGGVGLAGVVLTICVFPIVGVPLMVIGAMIILGGIAWVSMLGKESTRPVYCPYCSSKNDVYMSRQKFDCDICKRPIVFSPNGEALRAMEIEA